MNFCSHCAHALVFRRVEGGSRQRYVCDGCAAIHYANPKILVACIAYFEDRLLMCRRSREPDYGLWEVPSGFMEEGESLQQAASREVAEETGVRIGPDRLELYLILSLPEMSQVYIAFRSELETMPILCTGPECLDVAMKRESEVPASQWAFAGGVCGNPTVLFHEIRRRTFTIRMRSIHLER
jgi:hypothetical protein